MDAMKRGGLAAIAGAALAIAGNAGVLAADPAVSDDRVSYPLLTHAFQLGQIFFALTQTLMAWRILSLVRSGSPGWAEPFGVLALRLSRWPRGWAGLLLALGLFSFSWLPLFRSPSALRAPGCSW